MERNLFNDEHRVFRAAVRRFIEEEIVPHHKQWEADGIVPREIWRKAGENGYLCMDVQEQYGGSGTQDFRYSVIMIEELTRTNCSGPGFTVHSDIVVPNITKFGNDEQKDRYLSDLVTGKKIAAIGMTEAIAGSDLMAIQSHAEDEGEYFCLNGSKTFITNGIHADVIIVACKTAPERGVWGMTLLIVEADMDGFQRGRRLEKVGWRAQDTAELFFDSVHVPKINVLGKVGQGFFLLQSQLAQERIVIAVGAIAGARASLDQTIQYCKERETSSKSINKFQHNRFKLAEMETEITIGQVFIDRCIREHNAGKLTATQAAMAKWWSTELQKRVVDQCLQLHGGYGYMMEYPIAQIWLDMRWQTIGGGTTEILKDLIGREMGF